MKANNFTLSKDWIDAIPIRYGINELVQIDDLIFWKNDTNLVCQHFFNFPINDSQLNRIKGLVNEDQSIRFSYIDSELYARLNNWGNQEDIVINKLDEWEAPQLILNSDIERYLGNSTNTQTRRNYNEYKLKMGDYSFITSDIENVMKLWSDVLTVDLNSWKGQNNCDMKSLNREDLQYIFYLINNPDNTSLKVVYKDGIPLAYSLMFRANSEAMWYAVKWGASDFGREQKAGFYCLYNHLEELYCNNNELMMDFWGRRSQTYDRLKNNEVKRYHLSIGRR